MSRKLIIVLVNTDPRNGEELGAPFFHAAVAAAMNFDVQVICAATAGRLMKKGVAEKLTVKPGAVKTVYDFIRDAHEHFGEEVHAIRVQAGIARHALNVRTREVRYAFSPQDFGLGHTMPTIQEETPRSRRRPSRRDEEPEEAIIPAPFEDIAGDEEELEPLETSLESLDEGRDEEEEEDFFKLDNPVEDVDEDDEENVIDNEEDED